MHTYIHTYKCVITIIRTILTITISATRRIPRAPGEVGGRLQLLLGVARSETLIIVSNKNIIIISKLIITCYNYVIIL